MKTYDEMAESALNRIKAHEANKIKRRKTASRIAASALGIVFVAASVAMIRGSARNSALPDPDTAASVNEYAQEDPNGNVVAQSGEENTPETEKTYAVYTDPAEIPEQEDGVIADMIGCLVYGGSVYTQVLDYRYDLPEELLGEYLGRAAGSLDEWSSESEWSKEFASTYSGSVYAVKGYDRSFRLCVKTDGDGMLILLDNYDNIGLDTGADLFEERLHINGNIVGVSYLTHYEWNYLDPMSRSYKELEGVTDEQLAEFIDTLCESPFVCMDIEKYPYFYETEEQGHLYLDMKDGTSIELRLVEGGYVGTRNFGRLLVKMPGAIFDEMLKACR